ncbi:MAG: HEPN domain-containing protein [Nitrosopumilus sp.]
MQQQEFLIEGLQFLPEKVSISNKMVLYKVVSPSELSSPPHPQSYAIAYMAIGDDLQDFVEARSRLDFFLLIYSYMSQKTTLMFDGVSTKLEKVGDLGTHPIGFANYMRYTTKVKELDPLWDSALIKTKQPFLELDPDREMIIGSHIGLALRFYYYATGAMVRLSLDELMIHLTVAGEALAQTRRGRATENMRRRISALIEGDSKKRQDIYKNIGKLYSVRSNVVHGRRPKIKIDEATLLIEYTRRAIDETIKLRHMSKNELIQMLDKKFPEKRDLLSDLSDWLGRFPLKKLRLPVE